MKKKEEGEGGGGGGGWRILALCAHFFVFFASCRELEGGGG